MTRDRFLISGASLSLAAGHELASLEALCEAGTVQRASSFAGEAKLASGLVALDLFLDGGLPVGAVSEWGVPFGRGGREVVLAFLAGQPKTWALWVQGRSRFVVYPPAWRARGVDLPHLRFASAAHPVAELKPVFLDPLFKIIVLDAPREFSAEDCAFVSRQAREQQKTVILLRDYFLTPKRGNVWARLRLNCWQEARSAEFLPRSIDEIPYQLRVLRGLSARQMSLSLG